MTNVVRLRIPTNSQFGAVTAVSAAEVKNGFRTVVDRTRTEGVVAVTNHGTVNVVMLDLEVYNELVQRAGDPLAKLAERYDQMFSTMQEPEHLVADEALFGDVPPKPSLRVIR